jgi:hypothetical protein
MPKFNVSATNHEFLQQQEIEAESKEQAEEKYLDRWQFGNILVVGSEIGSFLVEEVK